jgi:hypothetical protein
MRRLGELSRLVQACIPRRRGGADWEAQLRLNVSVLALNLYTTYLASPGHCLVVSRNCNDYSGSVGAPTGISYRIFVEQALQGLEQLGFVEVAQRGFHSRGKGKGWTGRVRATGALIAFFEAIGQIQRWHIEPAILDNLVLRDSDKRPISFDETAQTLQMRATLTCINDLHRRNWLDLDISASEWRAMSEQRALAGKPVDLSRRFYDRIFNNASFQEGGRFYGVWWQNIPSKLRARITINGKPTVEVDFAGMHPRMLYQMEGLEPPEDPYDVGLNRRHRRLVKKAFNALLNAGPDGIRQFDEYDPVNVGMSWKDFLRLIQDRHSAIAHHFKTGVGVRLQYLDSQIAEAVMLRFAEMGVVCLCIHDSFTVHHGREQDLRRFMIEEYTRIVGMPPRLSANDEPVDCSIKEVDTDLDVLLDGLAAYGDFEVRRQAWFNERQSVR